jgi:hypothetical protein
VSAEAFADKQKRPSLFRDFLCDDPPLSKPPRLGIDQAVVVLRAARIRRADPILHSIANKLTTTHIVNLMPDQSEGQHRSHAVVYADPQLETAGAFKKLKVSLSILVEEEWAVVFSDEVIQQRRQADGT